MSARVEAVIAEALCVNMLKVNAPDKHGLFPVGGHHALTAAILAALKAARIAVVELPEPCAPPSYWHADCLGAWEAVNYGTDPVSAWPEKRGVALPDGAFISVDAARDLAAALLAAADAAEANQ